MLRRNACIARRPIDGTCDDKRHFKMVLTTEGSKIMKKFKPKLKKFSVLQYFF